MRNLLPGLCLAVAASVCFNLAIVVQAGEARALSSELNLRLSLLRGLAGRPRWLAGLALSFLAVPAQTAALLFAPLAVVQPADAVGLVVLLIAGGRRFGERAAPRDLMGVLGIALGVSAVVAGAPARGTHHDIGILIAVLGPLGVLSAAPLVFPVLRRRSIAGVLAAGLAFALGTFTLKLVADALDSHDWAGAAAWALAGATIAIGGTTSEMSALQVRPLARVAPLIFAIELLVPIALGVLIGGDSWSGDPGRLLLGLGGLALTLVGAFLLLRSPAVTTLLKAPSDA